MEEKQMSPIKLGKKQGTVYQLENGKFRHKKMVITEQGKRKEMCVTGSTIQECLKKMALKDRQLEQKKDYKINTPLADAMYMWVKNVKAPTLVPQSIKSLNKTIKNQIEPSDIGHMRYQSVTTEELQSLINKLNLVDHYSKSTIKKTYDALNAFYRYTSTVHKFDNPMELVVKPSETNIIKPTKEIHYLSEEDTKKFIMAALSTYSDGDLIYKYGPMIAANLFLGLRISELLALQWKDINLEENYITINKTLITMDNPAYDSTQPEKMGKNKIYKNIEVIQHFTKNKKTRYVAINSSARELILYYKKSLEEYSPENYVLQTRNGNTTNVSGIAKTLAYIQKRAGIENKITGTHELRHTCASFYFANDIPIEVICAILGNSREVCEKTYVHIIEKNKREAAAKINLPGLDLHLNIE